MKYILHYVGAMNRGGMENVIMNLYRGMDRSKYQFHFAVHTKKKSDWDETILKMGGKIIPFPPFRKNPKKYINTWDNFWNANKDIYQVFHYHTNSLANIAAIKSAVRNNMNSIIIHAHSSYADKGKFQIIHDFVHKRNQKIISKNSNLIRVAVSEKAATWLFGVDESNKVIIINNGVDYGLFRFNAGKRIELRKKLKIDNKIVIGHVGNFLKVKNHEFLIRLLDCLVKTNENIVLLLIGKGPLFTDIQKLAKELGLSNNVIFQGGVENPEDYLNAMDIFVFPSIYEGLALALLEAQINGLPVIYSSTISDEVEICDHIWAEKLEKEAAWCWRINALSHGTFNRKQGKCDDEYDSKKITKKFLSLYDSFESNKYE